MSEAKRILAKQRWRRAVRAFFARDPEAARPLLEALGRGDDMAAQFILQTMLCPKHRREAEVVVAGPNYE